MAMCYYGYRVAWNPRTKTHDCEFRAGESMGALWAFFEECVKWGERLTAGNGWWPLSHLPHEWDFLSQHMDQLQPLVDRLGQDECLFCIAHSGRSHFIAIRPRAPGEFDLEAAS